MPKQLKFETDLNINAYQLSRIIQESGLYLSRERVEKLVKESPTYKKYFKEFDDA